MANDTISDDGSGTPIMVDATADALHAKPSDSVFDAFPLYQPSMSIHPSDGIAVDNTPDVGDAAMAPSLDPSTFVCMKVVVDGKVVRPQCKFYKRQFMEDADIPGLKIVQRWCTHPDIKGLGGAALSLRDSTVPACELRDPPDATSEDALDAFDNLKIAQGKERSFYQMFKTTADVAEGRTHVAAPAKKA
jgi:hypothetical protein